MAEDETKMQSVRVVVRVRPMNDKELKNNTLPVVTGSTDKREVTLIRGVGQRQIRQTYNFDSVFTSFSSQAEVFQTIHPLISEVMQGFEATVRRAARMPPAVPDHYAVSHAAGERDLTVPWQTPTGICVWPDWHRENAYDGGRLGLRRVQGHHPARSGGDGHALPSRECCCAR